MKGVISYRRTKLLAQTEHARFPSTKFCQYRKKAALQYLLMKTSVTHGADRLKTNISITLARANSWFQLSYFPFHPFWLYNEDLAVVFGSRRFPLPARDGCGLMTSRNCGFPTFYTRAKNQRESVHSNYYSSPSSRCAKARLYPQVHTLLAGSISAAPLDKCALSLHHILLHGKKPETIGLLSSVKNLS